MASPSTQLSYRARRRQPSSRQISRKDFMATDYSMGILLRDLPPVVYEPPPRIDSLIWSDSPVSRISGRDRRKVVKSGHKPLISRSQQVPKVNESSCGCHQIMKVIIYLFSFAGCIFQLWSISAPMAGGYFAYDVVTTVNVKYHKYLTYPPRSICFYTSDVINWTQALTRQEFKDDVIGLAQATLDVGDNDPIKVLNVQHRGFDHKTHLMFDAIHKKHFTARETLNLVDEELLFEACITIDPRSYMSINQRCRNIRKFLLMAFTCFELSSESEQLYKADDLQTVPGLIPGTVFMAKLNDKFILDVNHSITFIHDWQELPSAKNNLFIFSIGLKSVFSISYTKYESDLLPSPYPTNCRDYSKDGSSTRVNCWISCVSNNTVKELKSGTSIVPITLSDKNLLDYKVLSEFGVLSEPGVYKQIRSITTDCSSKCQQHDCDDYNFVPVLLSRNDYHYNFYSFFMPFEPDITTDYVEKISLSSFLSDAASALGFWVGLSCLSFLGTSTDVIYKAFHMK